jgi:hypothetical protein
MPLIYIQTMAALFFGGFLAVRLRGRKGKAKSLLTGTAFLEEGKVDGHGIGRGDGGGRRCLDGDGVNQDWGAYRL